MRRNLKALIPTVAIATLQVSSSAYQRASVSWGLDPSGSRARGAPNVCAQMAWPVPDSCAGGGVPTFDY